MTGEGIKYAFVSIEQSLLNALKESIEKQTGLKVSEITLRHVGFEITPDLCESYGDKRWKEIQTIVNSSVAKMIEGLLQ